MIIRLLFLASTLTPAINIQLDFQAFEQIGTMRIDTAQERPVNLNIACRGDTLSITLIVPEANKRKDFDYEDFEGPDAPAGAKALSHIAWTTAAGTTEITHAAAGWYAPEPPESFMFGITQMSHHRQDPARLLAAISSDPGRLVWTQTGFDDAKRQLVASFELDAAAVRRLHNAASSCLPLSMPTNPGK